MRKTGSAFVRMLLAALAVSSISLTSVHGSESSQTCDVSDGTCSSESESQAQHCFAAAEEKGVCDEAGGIYSYGTAQAYKIVSPISLESSTKVYSVATEEEGRNYRFKPASWPISRKSFKKGSAPKILLSLSILSCERKNDGDSACCCQPLPEGSDIALDIWQARPDGKYSSLRDGYGDEFRSKFNAKYHNQVPFQFETLAPGSTGTMNGLGPGSWDTAPFGPPVIHILVSEVTEHAPLLVDIPILINPETLEQGSFSISDFRGAAWVRPKQVGGFNISSWTQNVDGNQIEIKADVYLPRDDKTLHPSDVREILCTSRVYGTPSSFFLEPMTICGRALTDYFAL